MENNLDTDQIKELVWRLAFPSMLAQFVSVFYSIVDRMYIGNIAEIGDLALAGVGICGPIVTMISSVAFWVGIGGSPLLSIRLGQKNETKAKEILANCFLLLSVMSVVITILSLALKNQLLIWFGASPAVFPYADEYITIYLMGTVFALLSTGMNQFIICQGFAKVGMKSVLLGAVGGYDFKVMGQVLLLGLTPFLIIAFDNILIISLNATIQKYGGAGQGDMLLTCNTILQSFMLIVTMPLSGITGGTQTILGYNYGAKRPDRI